MNNLPANAAHRHVGAGRIDRPGPGGDRRHLRDRLDRTSSAPPARRWRLLQNQREQVAPLMTTARRLIFAKGTDSHDYKFSSAALEDFYHVTPRVAQSLPRRQRLLAQRLRRQRHAAVAAHARGPGEWVIQRAKNHQGSQRLERDNGKTFLSPRARNQFAGHPSRTAQILVVLRRIEIAQNLVRWPGQLQRLVSVSANECVQALLRRQHADGGDVRPAQPGRMPAPALNGRHENRLRWFLLSRDQKATHDIGLHRRMIRGQEQPAVVVARMKVRSIQSSPCMTSRPHVRRVLGEPQDVGSAGRREVGPASPSAATTTRMSTPTPRARLVRAPFRPRQLRPAHDSCLPGIKPKVYFTSTATAALRRDSKLAGSCLPRGIKRACKDSIGRGINFLQRSFPGATARSSRPSAARTPGPSRTATAPRSGRRLL